MLVETVLSTNGSPMRFWPKTISGTDRSMRVLRRASSLTKLSGVFARDDWLKSHLWKPKLKTYFRGWPWFTEKLFPRSKNGSLQSEPITGNHLRASLSYDPAG